MNSWIWVGTQTLFKDSAVVCIVYNFITFLSHFWSQEYGGTALHVPGMNRHECHVGFITSAYISGVLQPHMLGTANGLLFTLSCTLSLEQRVWAISTWRILGPISDDLVGRVFGMLLECPETEWSAGRFCLHQHHTGRFRIATDCSVNLNNRYGIWLIKDHLGT